LNFSWIVVDCKYEKINTIELNQQLNLKVKLLMNILIP